MKQLLLIPGPTPVSVEVREALSRETISHFSQNFASIYKDVHEKMKLLFGTEHGVPFVIAGSGTLGMEISLTNILDNGENLLVISHGFFGDRFAEIGQSLGMNVDILSTLSGDHVDLKAVEDKLKEKHYEAITITHVDTSTGVLAQVESITKIVRNLSPQTLIVVDGVCATGGIEEKMDEWGVDVFFTGSQKAIAIPPGLAMLAFSSRAIEKRKRIKNVRTYYGDILRWIPVVEDTSKYFATPAVNMVFALQESLNRILDFGLPVYFEKHTLLAKKVRAAMSSLGFELVAKIPAPTLSVFRYPEGVDDESFRKLLEEKELFVAGGLKDLKGKTFRIGHMGSTEEEDLFLAIKRILETLEEMGIKVDRGKTLEAFLKS